MAENGPAVPDTNAIVLPVKGVADHLLPVNTLKATVPRGLKPPDTVALALAQFPTMLVVADTGSVSAAEFPMTIELAESAVVIDGVAFPTERDSELQTLVETPLLASPL